MLSNVKMVLQMMSHDKMKSLAEIGEIYKKVKRNTIYSFHLHGLSLREISRRIGGSTPPVVKRIINEMEEKREGTNNETEQEEN